MSRINCLLILSGLLVCLSGTPVPAFFQDATDGARPAGMGEAFVAIADDANAVLFNPADYARISCWELTGMYSDLYSGLDPVLYNGHQDRLGYNLVSLALPVSGEIGNFGAAWVQLQSEFYQENTFTLSYARRIWEPYQLDLGINAKLLSWNITGNEFNASESRTRATLDAGLLANVTEDFQIGAGFDNIVPADMGVDESEFVPWNFRLGGAYLYRLHWAALDSVQAQLELATRSVDYQKGNANLKFGLEAWLFNQFLALRTGVNRDVYACGLGLRYPVPGYRLVLQLDYAFTFPFELKYNLGSHRISLTLRCSKPMPTPTPEPTPKITPTPEPTPEAAQELEQKLRAVQKKIETGELKPIYFDLDKSTIKPESLPTLDYLGGILETYPTLRVRIEGHTDSQGDAEYNRTLSQSRVESASRYLTEKFKITAQNLEPIGYGEDRPIADNGTREGRAKNRRVEFHVISQNEQNAKIEISDDSRKLTIETTLDESGNTVTGTSDPTPETSPTVTTP